MIDITALSLLSVVQDMLLAACLVLVLPLFFMWLYRDRTPPPIPKRKKKFTDPLEEE